MWIQKSLDSLNNLIISSGNKDLLFASSDLISKQPFIVPFIVCTALSVAAVQSERIDSYDLAVKTFHKIMVDLDSSGLHGVEFYKTLFKDLLVQDAFYHLKGSNLQLYNYLLFNLEIYLPFIDVAQALTNSF